MNRRAWDELTELFQVDALVRVDTVTAPIRELAGPAALGAFIGSAIARFDFFEFVVLNTVVSVGVAGDATEATGRVFMCEIRRERDSGRYTVAFGVYHDHYRCRDGRWWFAGRHYQSLARTDPSEAFPFPPAFDRFVPVVPVVPIVREEHP